MLSTWPSFHFLSSLSPTFQWRHPAEQLRLYDLRNHRVEKVVRRAENQVKRYWATLILLAAKHIVYPPLCLFLALFRLLPQFPLTCGLHHSRVTADITLCHNTKTFTSNCSLFLERHRYSFIRIHTHTQGWTHTQTHNDPGPTYKAFSFLCFWFLLATDSLNLCIIWSWVWMVKDRGSANVQNSACQKKHLWEVHVNICTSFILMNYENKLIILKVKHFFIYYSVNAKGTVTDDT